MLPQELILGKLLEIRELSYFENISNWSKVGQEIFDDQESLYKEQDYFISMFSKLSPGEQTDVKKWISMDAEFKEMWELISFGYKLEETKAE